MLPSLELTVNPQASKTYSRLLVITHLLALLLIGLSSLYFGVKGLLIVWLGWQFIFYRSYQKPHPELDELRYGQGQWKLILCDGTEQAYDTVEIRIHNMLFQLLRLSSPNKNKILILFNDQLSKEQLRLLHLNTAKY